MTPPPVVPDQRPATRADCLGGARPCPWITCRHNLYLDVAIPGPGDGNRTILTAIQSAHPPDILPDLETLPETCALDVADRGGSHLVEIARYLGGISRERVRQVEEFALYKLGKRSQGEGEFDMTPEAKISPKRKRGRRRTS